MTLPAKTLPDYIVKSTINILPVYVRLCFNTDSIAEQETVTSAVHL